MLSVVDPDTDVDGDKLNKIRPFVDFSFFQKQVRSTTNLPKTWRLTRYWSNLPKIFQSCSGTQMVHKRKHTTRQDGWFSISI